MMGKEILCPFLSSSSNMKGIDSTRLGLQLGWALNQQTVDYMF